LVTLIRLESHKTDIAISINVPHIKDQFDEDTINLEDGKPGTLLTAAETIRDKILETFDIKDWNLFGEN
jgi:hypothetical protein